MGSQAVADLLSELRKEEGALRRSTPTKRHVRKRIQKLVAMTAERLLLSYSDLPYPLTRGQVSYMMRSEGVEIPILESATLDFGILFDIFESKARPVYQRDHRTLQQFMEQAPELFRLDYLREQNLHIELVSSQKELFALLRWAEDFYGVTASVCKNASYVSDLRKRVEKCAEEGLRIVALVLRDFSLRGFYIEAQVQGAVSQCGQCHTVALTPYLVKNRNLPKEKVRIPRSFKDNPLIAMLDHEEAWRRIRNKKPEYPLSMEAQSINWVKQNGPYTYALESLNPRELHRLVCSAIEKEIDLEKLQSAKLHESEVRSLIGERLNVV